MLFPFYRGAPNAAQVIAGSAFVAVALFAWAVGLQAITPPDPDIYLARPFWLLWQLGALGIAFAGAWQLWLGSRRVAWTRSLALGFLTLAIFLNAYTDWFGEYDGEVWQVVNPLFVAFASVAVVTLWRCGCAAGRIGAAMIAALAVVDLANAYFIDSGVVWQILNPLMMLAALAWAAGASPSGVSATAGSERESPDA